MVASEDRLLATTNTKIDLLDQKPIWCKIKMVTQFDVDMTSGLLMEI